MAEEWKAVKDYDYYKISSNGAVKRAYKLKTSKEKILKPTPCHGGYLHVSLCEDNNPKTFNVHRLVAEAFIPNPENKPQVNHINGNKTDNRVENLEWATDSENQLHAYKIGLRTGFCSEYAKQRCKEANQIISTWVNVELDLEFTGNSCELVKAFPEQELFTSALARVRNKKRKHHKGWAIKS